MAVAGCASVVGYGIVTLVVAAVTAMALRKKDR